MSKKDYTVIAGIFASKGQGVDGQAREVLQDTAREMASYFAEDNPNFSDVRFLDATTLFS